MGQLAAGAVPPPRHPPRFPLRPPPSGELAPIVRHFEKLARILPLVEAPPGHIGPRQAPLEAYGADYFRKNDPAGTSSKDTLSAIFLPAA